MHIHTYIKIYIYSALKSVKWLFQLLQKLRHQKNPHLSKAGPALDLQSFYWREKLKLVLCGRPQRNSWAAKACKCNGIYRCHEATRPVPAWFPINAEVQNTPSTLAHTTKVETIQPHSCETLKLPQRKQLSPHSYKWTAFTTPVVSWATASKTGPAVLYVCN